MISKSAIISGDKLVTNPYLGMVWIMGVVMGFEPKSGHHAIVEVVFGVTLNRPLSSRDIESIVQHHERWNELPRVNRSQTLQIIFGEGPIPPTGIDPAGGVSFDRFKSDGTLDWRLRVDQQAIYVNCLSYSGWQQIWPKARDYIDSVCSIALSNENGLNSAILQYIDVFNWVGDKYKYSVKDLFAEDSLFVPTATLNVGHIWHLHQGWFQTSDSTPDVEKSLERIHADGLEDASGTPFVKLDIFIQSFFTRAIKAEEAFKERFLDRTFDTIHIREKKLLSDLLVEDLRKRIGLDATA